jgi:tRNA threonylcarbamoyladenosine biosynthesis protein TsaB
MRTLGIELSTGSGSLAVVTDASVEVTVAWEDDVRGRQNFFSDIHRRVREGAIDFKAIDLVAVGIGPGSFSGLRMAVAAARAMAMTDRKPVFTVSSGEALAWEVFRERSGTGVSRICVAGDARRDEIWIGQFQFLHGLPDMVGDWDLAADENGFRKYGGQDAVWVTSDWDRIGARLLQSVPRGHDVLTCRKVPTAAAVADLAARKRAAGFASGGLAPVYVRPAVHRPAMPPS